MRQPRTERNSLETALSPKDDQIENIAISLPFAYPKSLIARSGLGITGFWPGSQLNEQFL